MGSTVGVWDRLEAVVCVCTRLLSLSFQVVVAFTFVLVVR
jgi:hypothetical protein